VTAKAVARLKNTSQRSTVQWVALIAGWSVAVILLLWVTVFASGTPAEPLVKEPGDFVKALLNGLTIAGLCFMFASRFTLIFGRRRHPSQGRS
jgi:hypothetical protein